MKEKRHLQGIDQVTHFGTFSRHNGQVDFVLYFKGGRSEKFTFNPKMLFPDIDTEQEEERSLIWDLAVERVFVESISSSFERYLWTYDSVRVNILQLLAARAAFDNLLEDNASIRNAIMWETAEGFLPYSEWSADQKKELRNAYLSAWAGRSGNLLDPPPNSVELQDDDYPTTVLAEEHAWPLYLAYVGRSLHVEIANLVNWSVLNYPQELLDGLLGSRSLFIWEDRYNGYMIENSLHGAVLPSPPVPTYRFLKMNNLIANDRYHTIGRVLNWCRENLVHYAYGSTAKNMEDQWQYRGWPPVSRIISGTPYTGYQDDIRHRTAGCHGTTGFLRAILRTINIPVRKIQVETTTSIHATPAFLSENMYLTHGDDPYSPRTKCTPPYPAEELLIDQDKFDEWLGPDLTAEERSKNLGRRVVELDLMYLSNYLLHLHCADLAAERSPEQSEVYLSFWPYYTLEALEEANLWARLDEKVESFGGCDHVP